LALEGAGERLQLVKADMLDYSSVASAVVGCEGVFHVASPVPSGQSSNPEVILLKRIGHFFFLIFQVTKWAVYCYFYSLLEQGAQVVEHIDSIGWKKDAIDDICILLYASAYLTCPHG